MLTNSNYRMYYISLLIKIEKSNLSDTVNIQMNAEPVK